jgi:hypothetical protein
VGRHGCPGPKPPQRVSRLLVCRTPCLGSVLHARTRVNQSLVRARCPIVCTSLSRHPSAALTALQELLHQSLQAALIAFEAVPPSSLAAPPRSSPRRAGYPSPGPRPVRALRRGWGVGLRRPSLGGAQGVHSRRCCGKMAFEFPYYVAAVVKPSASLFFRLAVRVPLLCLPVEKAIDRPTRRKHVTAVVTEMGAHPVRTHRPRPVGR